MYKKFKNFLDKCENIYLKTTKNVSSAEAVNALYGVLTKNEDPDLVKLNLTRSEKDTLVKEYNKIFTEQGKKLFWGYLNRCRSLATA